MILKFTAETGPLKALVDFVKSGLGAGKDLARQVVRFDLEGSNLGLVASDGDVYAWGGTVVDAPAGQNGSFAIMGKRLVGLVDQLSPERFEFEVDDENVRVTAGQSVVNFERYDAGLLAHTEAAQKEVRDLTPRPVEDEIQRGLLAEALAFSSSVVSRSSGKVELSHVEMRSGRLLASDGRRICVVESPHFPSDGVLKIPVTVLDKTASALKVLDGGMGVTSYEGAGFFYLCANNRVLAFRKTANEFPAVEKTLTQDYGVDSLEIDRSALQIALRDVALGLASDRAEIGFSDMGNGSGELTAENSLGRESRVPFDIAARLGKDGSAIKFPISMDHLKTTLGAMTSDKILLEAIPDHKFVRITDAGADRKVVAVLPFRKSSDPAQPAQAAGDGESTEDGFEGGTHESGVVL